MKVVIVSKALVRGAYQRTLEEMASAGLELTVISPPGWREGMTYTALERQYTRGYNLLVTPIAFNGRYHLHFYPRLPFLLRALGPDLVHIDEEPYNLATWLAVRSAQAVGAQRTFYTWQNTYRRLPPPFSLLEADVYRLVRGGIAANADAAAVLRRKGFKRPIWTIPPGLDLDLYGPREVASHDTFQIGYVGRLVPEKGIDLLLRACAGLKGNWRLDLIGEGEERGGLERLAQDLGVRDRIAFRGRVASTEVPGVLPSFDVIVLPSRTRPNWREQFGRILMEAMACCVPVIGSSSGEIPQVIGEAGLVFPENDSDALAAHLARLQGDPEFRKELGRLGRARVLSHFSHRTIAERTIGVFRAIVSDGRIS